MSDVLFAKIGRAAVVTLNRPKALNALNVGMIEDLYEAYRGYERDGTELVVLEGAGGKAFCAGGDVRALWEDRSGAAGRQFFTREYRLNYKIGSLTVPHVALIDGIVMGGGGGVSVHGKYRVATEKTVFAMPETAIGLFPDVGSSIFLPRMGALGTYLGLTGHRLKGYETVAAGIATHYIQSDQMPQLKAALAERGLSALEELCEQRVLAAETASVAKLVEQTDRVFRRDSVEEIVAVLKSDASPWAAATLEQLRRASPTSLKVTLRMLRNAPKTREECFALEFRLAHRFLERNGDFFEGVRAVLVDKDNAPKWDPATLELVKDVDFYFNPLSAEQSARLILQ